MQRALLAALLVGLAAPVIGTYLVQRRLALLGDGIGHVALTGVAAGWLAGAVAGLTPPDDALAVPGAVVAAVLGAVGIELVREARRTTGDVALAILFYGGIAGGVLLISRRGRDQREPHGLPVRLDLDGVGRRTCVVPSCSPAPCSAVGLGLRGALFAVSHDEEFARASGLPVRALQPRGRRHRCPDRHRRDARGRAAAGLAR